MKSLLKILLFVVLLCACQQKPKQTIGVWTTITDEWGQQMLQEMKFEAAKRPDIELLILQRQPGDGTGEEMDAIEGFIKKQTKGIILVSNNRYLRNHMVQAIEANIPVVLINNDDDKAKCSTRVIHDQTMLGHKVAHQIVKMLNGRGHIMEITGVENIDNRYNGIHEVLDSFPDIVIDYSFCGHYRVDSTENYLRRELPQIRKPIDLVLGYNDRMVIGAHNAFIRFPEVCESWKTKFIGIDCLMSDSVGIGRIKDGTLDGSFLWPTGGTEAMQQMFNILDGYPYEKEVAIQTRYVTKKDVPALQSTWNARHKKYLQDKEELDEFSVFKHQREQQHYHMWIAYSLVLLLMITTSVLLYSFRTKSRQIKQLSDKNLLLEGQMKQLQLQCNQQQEERNRWMELKAAGENVNQEEPVETGNFRVQLLQLIKAHLSEEDLSVEELSKMMLMSRVQLFRRVKQEFQMSPSKLFQTIRLEEAEKLLRTTQLTVSEVSYRVGYTSIKYFSKCFKEHFGKNPSDLRLQSDGSQREQL